MNELELFNNEPIVTTKELADTLGVEPRTIQLAIKRLDLANVLSQVKIRGKLGYVFTQQQATLIKQEIQKHHNLATRQIDEVQTEIEVLSNAVKAFQDLKRFTEQKIAEKDRLIAEQKPKVDYFDRLVDVSAETTATDFAKEIPMKRSELIDWMIAKGLWYRDSHNSLKAYAEFVPKFFKQKDWEAHGHSGVYPVFTTEGKRFVLEKLNDSVRRIEQKD